MNTENTEKQVRWGILSTAHINRRLIPEFHASERCTLDAVASRNLQKATDYATQWDIPRAYPDYEELLKDEALDVIYISLPNDLHTEWTIRALEAGKHVLCEKPLCLTMHELEQIFDATARTGKTVMEAFMYLHHPQTALFRDLVTGGEIGDVVAIYSEFAATFNRAADNYRMDASKGGGALWDIGVYPVSFFLHLMSGLVIRHTGRAVVKDGIDVNFWGRIDFDSGVTGQFYASFESAYSTRTSIMGTGGRIDISHPFNAVSECIATLTKGDKTSAIELPRASLYAGEIEALNDLVLMNKQPSFSLKDSREVLGSILALRKSAGLDI